MVAFNGNRINISGDYEVGGDNRMTAGLGFKYEYDDEGNRILRYIGDDDNGLDSGDYDITQYSWDHRNRLVKVEHFDDYEDYAAEESDQSVEYAYDYQNRLIHRALDPDGSAASNDPIEQTAYVYDGNQVVLQFEKTGTGDILATDLAHRDLWGPAVDQLLAQENVHYVTDHFVTDNLFWALTDNLNTVRDLVSYNGSATSLESHRVFDAFGNKKYETDAVDCVFNYTGKLFDDKTLLQNNLNRWYEPSTGKWLSVDPIGFEGGDENLYRYCKNSSIGLSDPSGMGFGEWCGAFRGGPYIPPATPGCDAAIKAAESDPLIKKIRDEMKKNGCEPPNIICVCEKNPDIAGSGSASTIFIYDACNVSESSALETLRHEYVHALDNCMGNIDIPWWPWESWDCAALAATEVRAHSMTGECDSYATKTGPDGKKFIDEKARRECVRANAIESVGYYSECRPGDFWVDLVLGASYVPSGTTNIPAWPTLPAPPAPPTQPTPEPDPMDTFPCGGKCPA